MGKKPELPRNKDQTEKSTKVQPIRIESSDKEPGHCEPDQPKYFDHEPTIDELNDGNHTRDGVMKDPKDEAAPSNLERNGKKIKCQIA